MLQVLRKPQQTLTPYKPCDPNLKDIVDPVPNLQVHPNTHYVNPVSERSPRQIQTYPQEEDVGTHGVAAETGAAEAKGPAGAGAEAFHASVPGAATPWLRGTRPPGAAPIQTP